MSNVIEIRVPSGIGDISWLYSKLKHVPEDFCFAVADGFPRRSLEYLERLPKIKGKGNCYKQHNYVDILHTQESQKFNSWSDVQKSGREIIWLENNQHLEKGLQLDTWFTDLPSDYHYEMETSEEEKAWASEILKGVDRPVGIFMANLRGQRAWKGWDATTWNEFCQHIMRDFHDVTFVLTGAFYDRQLTDELSYLFDDKGIKYVNTTGKTNIGQAIELLKKLKYWIGFSSGLGVLATIVNTPSAMMYPEHQWGLVESWCAPEMVKTGLYQGFIWDNPTSIYRAIYKTLKKTLENK